nr:MAG TPA: cell wall-associated hydrolase [Caudoviricetes sp.]
MDNLGLIKFAESKIGTPYVYGMKGSVLTTGKYEQLRGTYGELVWKSDRSKIGKVCVDCSGLISWYTGVLRGSAQYKAAATSVHPISTIVNAPLGALVWRKGHIGIYVGNGEYIAADGSAYGVRRNKLSNASFTHWFLCVDIAYIKKEVVEEMVENSKMIVNGKEIDVKRILNNGTNYIAIRDVANALGCTVGYKGNIAVLTKR